MVNLQHLAIAGHSAPLLPNGHAATNGNSVLDAFDDETSTSGSAARVQVRLLRVLNFLYALLRGQTLLWHIMTLMSASQQTCMHSNPCTWLMLSVHQMLCKHTNHNCAGRRGSLNVWQGRAGRSKAALPRRRPMAAAIKGC